MDIKDVLNQAFKAQQVGNYEQAEACYASILKHHSYATDAMHYYGLLLFQMGKIPESEKLFKSAITLSPTNPVYYVNYVQALIRQKNYTQALVIIQDGVNKLTDFKELLKFRLHIYQQTGDEVNAKLTLAILYYTDKYYEQALEMILQIIKQNPQNNLLHFYLGCCYNELARYEEAIQAYKQSIELDATFSEAHFNLALVQLRLGRFEQAWPEYEYRWHLKAMPSRLHTTQPYWEGTKLDDTQTLLIATEQGLGDSIQMIRYLPMVQAYASRLVVQCAPELLDLFASSYPEVTWIDTKSALPAFDLYVSTLSLPYIFKTTATTIPHTVPYLKSSKTAVLPATSKKLKVGICWAGNPAYQNNARRVVALAALAPLFNLPDIQFYSLYKGHSDELATYEQSIIDLAPELASLDDTANYINQLDLVITIDTVIAHLAGALAKPVWIMLPLVPDWRWQLNRADSPWYPTAQLFRQVERDNWATVIAAIQQALIKLDR